MELVCPVMVLYVILSGAICMEVEATSNIRGKKTCPVETFQAVMKISRADVTTDSCPIKSEPVEDNRDSSQLPPWLCFKDECMSCGDTEHPARCFFRGILPGLIKVLKKWIYIIAIVCILCIGYVVNPDMYGRLV